MIHSIILSSLTLLASTEASQSILALLPSPDLCNTYEKNALLNTAHINAFLNSSSCYEASPKRPLAISKPTPPKTNNKWTTKPICQHNAENQEFCVYTNTHYANNRGISFFTTPSIATKVLSLPAFTNPSLLDSANDFANAPWEVRNIPGKGKGLFATRKLERGDLILANTPLGAYNTHAFTADPGLAPGLGYQYLRKTLEQLPEKSQESFLGAATHAEGDVVVERIKTNAYVGEIGGGGAFYDIINHDCRPNSMYYHSATTLTHSTHASRTIHPGEEITVSYINPLQFRKERHEALNRWWGFTCTCSLCSAPDAEHHHSDQNMEKIVQLQTELSDWTPTSPATPKLAEKLVKTYKDEGLHSVINIGHMFAAFTYNAVGNVAMAFEHAGKAVETSMGGTGSVNDDEVDMWALLQNPKGHWSYMKRVRF
ncbi:hypothetical protein HYALB_00006242, partial [Hymenoscyphus albidus]